jgi:hypothetical protein
VESWLEVEPTEKPREVLVRVKVAILLGIIVNGLFYSENKYNFTENLEASRRK